MSLAKLEQNLLWVSAAGANIRSHVLAHFDGYAASGPRLGQHPPCLLDVHSLDHLAFEALGAAGGGGEEALGRRHLLLAGGPRTVGGLDLAGVDEPLAVEAHPPSLRTLGGEAVRVAELVIDSVEGGRPDRPGADKDG